MGGWIGLSTWGLVSGRCVGGGTASSYRISSRQAEGAHSQWLAADGGKKGRFGLAVELEHHVVHLRCATFGRKRKRGQGGYAAYEVVR